MKSAIKKISGGEAADDKGKVEHALPKFRKGEIIYGSTNRQLANERQYKLRCAKGVDDALVRIASVYGESPEDVNRRDRIDLMRRRWRYAWTMGLFRSSYFPTQTFLIMANELLKRTHNLIDEVSYMINVLHCVCVLNGRCCNSAPDELIRPVQLPVMRVQLHSVHDI